MSQNQNQGTGTGDVAGNARAAAAVATAAREQTKKEWYNSVWLHVVLAIALIAISIIIANTYDFNLFWGLIVGGTIIWIAGKLSRGKVAIVKHWGVVLRVVGWVVLATALVPSGLRYFAEFAVEGANSTLCRWSGKACGGAASSTVNQSSSRDEPSGEEITFNLAQHGSVRQTVKAGDVIKLILPAGIPHRAGEPGTIFTGCPKIVAPPVVAAIRGNPLERMTDNYRQVIKSRLNKEIRDMIIDNRIPEVTLEYVKGTLVVGSGPDCVFP